MIRMSWMQQEIWAEKFRICTCHDEAYLNLERKVLIKPRGSLTPASCSAPIFHKASPPSMAYVAGHHAQCWRQRIPAYRQSCAVGGWRQLQQQSRPASRQSVAPGRLQLCAAASATVETVKPSSDLDSLSKKPAAQQSTVVITGANSGLGLAAAKALTKTGMVHTTRPG